MRTKDELRPYQERIATALYENDEQLCALRPGGGKTAAALTAIVELLRDGVIRHALIIAPKRVARVVWPDEIEAWAHANHLRYAVLTGDPKYRWGALRQAHNREITIVGIDVLPWLIEQLTEMDKDKTHPHPLYDLLVIDEASRLRKPGGVRAKALAKHAHNWKMIWGLSGTLRPSGADDLFMPVRIVTRGKLWGRSFHQWRKDRFYPTDFMGYKWAPLPGAEEQINADIAPLTIMVDEQEMPQVKPTIVFDKVELPVGVRIQYDQMTKKLITKTHTGETIYAVNAAVATGKLAQMANGFVYGNLDDADEDPRERPETHQLHFEKRDWLTDLLSEAVDPVLVIYEYQADLEMLKDQVYTVHDEALRYLGAGVSDKQAAANIADWNAGKLKVMGLHPASGGHGLNLQHGGADMAWIGPIWSPEYWEQTIARLARPGQTRPVVVRVCVAVGTVDEMKLNRVYHKMSAQEAFETWVKAWRARQTAAAEA